MNEEKKEVIKEIEELEKEDKQVVNDDELIEDVDSKDDAPVKVVYRCKKCGQILSEDATDCWRCSSKDIEEVVEEETKELKKVMLSARIEKLEHEVKSLKSNNNFLYGLIAVIAVAICIYFIANR